MPRPTAAQLAYGSCTVVLSTVAMLLLSQTSSGVGIAVIAFAALALGLLVAMTVPVPGPRAADRRPAEDQAPARQHAEKPVPVPVTGSSRRR
ncbi:hypothetical protein ACIQKE_28180 [Streptomyces griseoviridis]